MTITTSTLLLTFIAGWIFGVVTIVILAAVVAAGRGVEHDFENSEWNVRTYETHS